MSGYLRIPVGADSPDVYAVAMAEFEATLRASDAFEDLLLDAYFERMREQLPDDWKN